MAVKCYGTSHWMRGWLKGIPAAGGNRRPQKPFPLCRERGQGRDAGSHHVPQSLIKTGLCKRNIVTWLPGSRHLVLVPATHWEQWWQYSLSQQVAAKNTATNSKQLTPSTWYTRTHPKLSKPTHYLTTRVLHPQPLETLQREHTAKLTGSEWHILDQTLLYMRTRTSLGQVVPKRGVYSHPRSHTQCQLSTELTN